MTSAGGMASNFLSRLLPPREGEPSVYETLRAHDESSDVSDLEERAGMALDEENLGGGFEHYDFDHAAAAQMDESQMTTESTAFLAEPSREGRRASALRSASRPKWMGPSRRAPEPEEGDDEVPLSLLTEGVDDTAAPGLGAAGGAGLPPPPHPPSPIPGPATAEARARWESTQARQRIHPGPREATTARLIPPTNKFQLSLVDPKERAMWRWANVENLDNFLKDVYDYYLGNGIWCIMLSRVLNLLTLAFVVGFTTFLTICIDYGKVPNSKTMSQIMIPQCTKTMSGTTNVLLWLFAVFWIGKVFQYLVDIRRLRHIHDFYVHLLEIDDANIQTISWQDVVARLMTLRDANPVTADGVGVRNRRYMGHQSKQRMDAHDIANRLMRKENYLIALFNKDILDLTLPIPFLRHRQLFSKTLEWNLNLCILDYVFNEQGQVRPLFLKDTHRRKLSEGLRRRFLFAGTMNVVCAPFIVVYLMMLYFFRYFTEFQRNPSQLGSRQYTPLAEWKFREFNELWHLFQRRINMSYPFATRYVDQFPKDKTTQLSRFVAFVSGALAAVLALASVIDPELFLGFEITPERTVLFYLGVFGTVWAMARGGVPEETLVFDPEFALNNVIEYTRYVPTSWRGRLHSDEVRKEFAALYQMKIVIFLEEILSIIFTPFVLWFSLPTCSDRLVDFFREFTVHVDGLGYVCSFAVFDFQRGGDNTAGPATMTGPDGRPDLRQDYYATKDGKMLASYFGFLDNYATNPRTGIGPMHPAAVRHFHPPPSFPGLMSPTLDGAAGVTGHLARRPASSGKVTGSTAGLRMTGRGRTAAPHGQQSGSLGMSILLDPHHQPATSQPRPRFATGSVMVEAPEEADEAGQSRGPPQRSVAASSGSGGMADDSKLGDSWKTTRATAEEEDELDEEDVDGVTGERGGAGVLGLLYQFQKAQAEGRGTGVNIG
ncbi:MAG: autophagy protein atg9 [Thelocarpon superellum]|nr:MAG: autophagy protein atg9 [Thelocarpon superellum]